MGSRLNIELEEFGLEVEREHHALIHDPSSSVRPALIDGGGPQLYKTDNGNDKTVGECKLSNENMGMISKNEDADVNEVESSENEYENDVDEVESPTTEEIKAEAKVGTTLNDMGIEVEMLKEKDEKVEMINQDDEQHIIDNNKGLEAVDNMSKVEKQQTQIEVDGTSFQG